MMLESRAVGCLPRDITTVVVLLTMFICHVLFTWDPREESRTLRLSVARSGVFQAETDSTLVRLRLLRLVSAESCCVWLTCNLWNRWCVFGTTPKAYTSKRWRIECSPPFFLPSPPQPFCLSFTDNTAGVFVWSTKAASPKQVNSEAVVSGLFLHHQDQNDK